MTITFTTDFEPHRIKTMRKNPPKPSKPGSSLPAAKPPKERTRSKAESEITFVSPVCFPKYQV